MSINISPRNLWSKRPIRFICVGLINTFTDITLLNIFVLSFGFKLITANLMSASISIVLSYFLNHFIVFQNNHKLGIRPFLKFILITGVSVLLIQSLTIYILQHLFTLNILGSILAMHGTRQFIKVLQINGAKIIAVMVGMVWNYMLYHIVVFRDNKDIVDEGVVSY